MVSNEIMQLFLMKSSFQIEFWSETSSLGWNLHLMVRNEILVPNDVIFLFQNEFLF